ncbi:hypothetical protein L2U69_16995 [Zavarzinia compransoris]|uniref:sterol desaturase family protein n=1 Tax=Zavarzinia marina TaxID=2911065 RepID=UPI001F29FAFC|nr:hypothetical protein [Zavarzinia marina]MCF4167349.1 hypothetical protein [Zavarzinia marina]
MTLFGYAMEPSAFVGVVTLGALCVLVLYEWASGKYGGGRKTANDWKMFALSGLGVGLVERPALAALVAGIAALVVPQWAGAFHHVEQTHFWACLVAFLLMDEFLHGLGHYFAHQPPPANWWAAKVHAFMREAHRAHHQLGDDERAELSVTQSVVAGWGWLFLLPNYWFGLVMLYLGFVECFVVVALIKTLWGMHVHTNWQYDLYLLNHGNRFVRGAMRAAAHVLTFPNQHHQHHSRSPNSAKNLQNVLALFDWLVWGTLVIETERPAIYGWRQQPRERNVFHRYFARPLKTPRKRLVPDAGA